MIILKDILVSPNRPPVQRTLWIRPLGNSKIKTYYPSGGEWKEVNSVGSPDGQVIPDEDLAQLREEIVALQEADIVHDAQIERLSRTIEEQEKTIANMSNQLKANKLDLTYFMTNSSIQVGPELPSLLGTGVGLTADELPKKNLTENILNALFKGLDNEDFVSVKLWITRLDRTGVKWVQVWFGADVEGTADNYTITLTETNFISPTADLIVYTITKSTNSSGKVLYSIASTVRKGQDDQPFDPGSGPSGPSGPGGGGIGGLDGPGQGGGSTTSPTNP